MPARCLLACLAAIALAALVASPARGARLTSDSRITHSGVGPIHLNMTVPEARRAAARRIDVGPEVTRG